MHGITRKAARAEQSRFRRVVIANDANIGLAEAVHLHRGDHGMALAAPQNIKRPRIGRPAFDQHGAIGAARTGRNRVVREPAFAVGDQVVAQFQPRPAPCNLAMEPVTAIAGTTVSVATGAANNLGILFNLGQAPKVLAYAVRAGNLTVCDYIANDCSVAGSVANTAIWVPVASNIVSLRAEYGRDTTAPMDGTVDAFDQTAPANACDWSRISAVRFALVARNSELDKASVTTAAPTWAAGASAPIDLTADANWQNYRYKTFQTIVPLRNMAWQGAQSGC